MLRHPSPRSLPPLRRLLPSRLQMIPTRFKVVPHGTSIISSSSKSLGSASKGTDRMAAMTCSSSSNISNEIQEQHPLWRLGLRIQRRLHLWPVSLAAKHESTHATNTHPRQNSAIASAVTNLNNLQGIPNAVNSFKKQVFTQNLTGVGGPSQGNDARYFNFFGPAVKKYLTDNQAALMAGTVDNTGNELQSAGNNNVAVKDYFTSYASLHYQGCINYLATSWTGKPLPTSTSAAASSTTAAGAASVTCYHAADPENTCAAVADGPGWCECGYSPTTYAVMPSGASQPCGWTTTPPTTSFNCAASPTPTPTATSCNVPAGCTNAAAPTGCAVECS